MSDDELFEAWIMSATDATFDEWRERGDAVVLASASNAFGVSGLHMSYNLAMQNCAQDHAARQAAAMQNTHALGTFGGTLGQIGGAFFPNRLF